MPSALSKAIANARDRRSFIGGSDARIIMGADQAALLQLWREKRGEASPKTSRAISWCSSGERPKSSIGTGTKLKVARKSSMFKSMCGTLACSGWGRRSTDASDQAERSSRASSCFRGHSPKKPLSKSMRRSCSTRCDMPPPICGSV